MDTWDTNVFNDSKLETYLNLMLSKHEKVQLCPIEAGSFPNFSSALKYKQSHWACAKWRRLANDNVILECSIFQQPQRGVFKCFSKNSSVCIVTPVVFCNTPQESRDYATFTFVHTNHGGLLCFMEVSYQINLVTVVLVASNH